MLSLYTWKIFSQLLYLRYFTSRKIIKELMLNNATQNFNIMIFGKNFWPIPPFWSQNSNIMIFGKKLLIYLTIKQLTIKQFQELLEKVNFCENLPKRVV